jgi:predicted lipoprotein with Yx(FWY)xxD motif
MRHIVFSGLAALAVAGTLAACSGSGSGSSGGAGGAGSSAPAAAAHQSASSSTDDDSTYGSGSTAGSTAGGAAAAPAGSAVLATASSSLGTIVVDGKGMTAYEYTKDQTGGTSSACGTGCAQIWPAIETSSSTPSVQGVTGKIGTITGVDGKLQVTLNGHPLYTFIQDSKKGDTNGQGYDGIWWVMAPDGSAMSH